MPSTTDSLTNFNFSDRASLRESHGQMPVAYCSSCGGLHKKEDCASCNMADESPKRRNTRSAKQKQGKKQDESELSDSCGESTTLTLEEQKQAAKKEIERLELEEEVAKLITKRNRLRLRGRERRVEDSKEKEDGGESAGRIQRARETSRDDETDDSEECTSSTSRRHTPRSRDRRRHRRRRGSSSSSSSRSASRRRKRKWALKKYVSEEKDLKKANCYELIGATAEWVLDKDNMSISDYKAMFEHVSFLTERAKLNEYYDKSHVDYDKAIRRLALREGFAAFGMANQRLSVRYYGSHHLRFKRSSNFRNGGPRNQGHGGKRVCYAWNGESGCPRSEQECRFGHYCSTCHSKGHKKSKCKE